MVGTCRAFAAACGAIQRVMHSRAYFAPAAWLPDGWARDVRIAVGRDGLITTVTPYGDADGAARLGGPVVPGMVDAHSHAFQRAMAGLAERAGPAGDSFWS